MAMILPTERPAAAQRGPRLSVFPKGFFDALVARRLDLFEWIRLAGTLGVDGLELYPRFFESFDDTYVARVRAAAAGEGLALPMLCNSPDFTQPEPGARAAEVARTRRMLEVTAALGGRWCRVLSGQNRPGLDARAATAWVVECLEALIPAAEATGVVMVMENHYKDGLWEYPEFAQSTARYLEILRAVDSPWLAAQYDPSNAIVAGEDQYELLEAILPRLETMQASDRYLEGGTLAELRRFDADPLHGYARYIKHGVIGHGLNDYDRIFRTLARAGYRGWISIEDGEGPTIAEGMANLRASVGFLRDMIAAHYADRDGEVP
jgi:sugar phosphate isomerase/epimerase